jgi:hypothetical protein
LMAFTNRCTPYCGSTSTRRRTWSRIQLYQPRPLLLDDLADNLLQSLFHLATDDRPTVLWAPHHVERALERDIRVGVQRDGHIHSIQR